MFIVLRFFISFRAPEERNVVGAPNLHAAPDGAEYLRRSAINMLLLRSKTFDTHDDFCAKPRNLSAHTSDTRREMTY
jgi:hypothetical protein